MPQLRRRMMNIQQFPYYSIYKNTIIYKYFVVNLCENASRSPRVWVHVRAIPTSIYISLYLSSSLSLSYVYKYYISQTGINSGLSQPSDQLVGKRMHCCQTVRLLFILCIYTRTCSIHRDYEYILVRYIHSSYARHEYTMALICQMMQRRRRLSNFRWTVLVEVDRTWRSYRFSCFFVIGAVAMDKHMAYKIYVHVLYIIFSGLFVCVRVCSMPRHGIRILPVTVIENRITLCRLTRSHSMAFSWRLIYILFEEKKSNCGLIESGLTSWMVCCAVLPDVNFVCCVSVAVFYTLENWYADIIRV